MSNHSIEKESFFKKQIPIGYFISAILFIVIFVCWHYISRSTKANASDNIAQQSANCPPPATIQYRMGEYKYTKPLLIADRLNASDSNDPVLKDIRNSILQIIENKKQDGHVTACSVNLRKFSGSFVISINDDEYYNPASLLKIPVLMTFLRESELKPGLLNKEVYFDKSTLEKLVTYFPDETIKPGRKYTVKELLNRMIIYSDNEATNLLDYSINLEIFTQLFNDLQIPLPDFHNLDNQKIRASDVSKFLRVLYNASYLQNENADYALALMAKSNFKQGMLSGLPSNIVIAHKFAEAGQEIAGTEKQLHETGIIYLNDEPVLLTVMTRGKDIKQLPSIISEITKCIYNKLNKASS